jgi:hypothetical protein
MFIAAFGTVLYTTRGHRGISCECNYQSPQGSGVAENCTTRTHDVPGMPLKLTDE